MGVIKYDYFFRLEIFVDIFWGSLLNWIIFMGYFFKLSATACVL